MKLGCLELSIQKIISNLSNQKNVVLKPDHGLTQLLVNPMVNEHN